MSGEFTFRPTFSDQVDYSMLKDGDITVKSLLPTGDTAAAVQAVADIVADYDVIVCCEIGRAHV